MRTLYVLALLALCVSCRLFELGDISCDANADCPRELSCVDQVCRGEGVGEGEGEPACTSNDQCQDRPDCLGCVCGNGQCQAPCVAGECPGGSLCFTDGLCHVLCGNNADCQLREYCAFTGDIFDPVLACFIGCSDDSGCDAGQVCSLDNECVPGAANSKNHFDPCAGASECRTGLVCFSTSIGGVCAERCDNFACGDAPQNCCLVSGLECGPGYCTRPCFVDDCPGASTCDADFGECLLP